eukprot:TRINITY_DN20275_c0_g1_i2.p1 TRINITY_DN20275_c0_g1~~TRINITY_DN20275_c0_g1_i2.p1  ORF type:complete len:994 (+),score=190.62 TRINITY_DN20275_c0_g1_i2:52-2982(+)
MSTVGQRRRRTSVAASCQSAGAVPSRRPTSALHDYSEVAVTRAIYRHAREYIAEAPQSCNRGRWALASVRRAARAVILETSVIRTITDIIDDKKQLKARIAEDLWKKLSLEVRSIFGDSADDSLVSDAARRVADALAEMLAMFEGAGDVRDKFMKVASSYRDSEASLRALQASFGDNLDGLQVMQNTIERCSLEAIRLLAYFEGNIDNMRVQLHRTLKSPKRRRPSGQLLMDGSGDAGEASSGPADSDYIGILLHTLERDLCDRPMQNMMAHAEEVNAQMSQTLKRSLSGRSLGDDTAMPGGELTPAQLAGDEQPSSAFGPSKLLEDMMEVLKPCLEAMTLKPKGAPENNSNSSSAGKAVQHCDAAPGTAASEKGAAAEKETAAAAFASCDSSAAGKSDLVEGYAPPRINDNDVSQLHTAGMASHSSRPVNSASADSASSPTLTAARRPSGRPSAALPGLGAESAPPAALGGGSATNAEKALLLADCSAAEIKRREGRKADAPEAAREAGGKRSQVAQLLPGEQKSPLAGSTVRARARTEGDVDIFSTWPLSAAGAAGLTKGAETAGRVHTPETQDGKERGSGLDTDDADYVRVQCSQELLGGQSFPAKMHRHVRSPRPLQETGIYDSQLSTAALGLSPGAGYNRLLRPGDAEQDQDATASSADVKLRVRSKESVAKSHRQGAPLDSSSCDGAPKVDKLPPLNTKQSDALSSPAMSVPTPARFSGNVSSEQRRRSPVNSKQERAEAPRYQRPTISSSSVASMPALGAQVSSRPGSSCGLEQMATAAPVAVASESSLAGSPLRVARSRRLERGGVSASYYQQSDNGGQGVSRSSSEPFFVSKAYAPVERNAEPEAHAKFRKLGRGLPPPRSGSGPGSVAMLSSEKLRGQSLLSEGSPSIALSPVRRPSPLFDGPWHQKEPASKATCGSLLPAVDAHGYKPGGERFLRRSKSGVSLATNLVKEGPPGNRPANDHNFLK